MGFTKQIALRLCAVIIGAGFSAVTIAAPYWAAILLKIATGQPLNIAVTSPTAGGPINVIGDY